MLIRILSASMSAIRLFLRQRLPSARLLTVSRYAAVLPGSTRVSDVGGFTFQNLKPT